MNTTRYMIGLGLGCLSVWVHAVPVLLSTAQQKQANIQTIRLSPPANQQVQTLNLQGQAIWPLNAQYVLSAPVAGMIDHVAIQPLQPIGKGQAVATLYSAALGDWQSELMRAQEQQKLANAQLKRETQLWQEGIIAQKRVIEAQSQLAQANLMLAQSRQRLALIGASVQPTQLSAQLAIKSPHQGTISELLVSLGQYVEAGTPIAKVVRSSKLDLELYATVAQGQQIRTGDVVQVQGCQGQGRVQSVAPSLHGTTQRQVVRVDWPNVAGCLKPAQYLNATVQTALTDTKAQGWYVPAAAVVRQGGQSMVFVQVGQGFEAIAVHAQATDAKTQLIQSKALRSGQSVVVQGALTLKSIANGLGADQAPVAVTR